MGGVEADCDQSRADLLHERQRAAQVRLGVDRQLQPGEERRGQVPCVVEVAPFEIGRIGSAVADAAARIRE
jgi:hypothetical protein